MKQSFGTIYACIFGPVCLLFIAVIVAVLFAAELIIELFSTRNLNYLTWRIGLRKSCPCCGGLILRHGWEPNEYYTCLAEKCSFNK